MKRVIIIRGKTGSGKTRLLSAIRKVFLHFKSLEIDSIKIKKYNTTTKCDPQVDFPEAGRKVYNLKRE